MTHYGVAQLADLARGASATDAAATRSHLAECAECREAFTFCEELSRLCLAMAETAAPDWLVRRAKEICPAPVENRKRRSARIPVELVFDSFLMPAPAGLRATWQIGWQGLYRAGDCSLDLRIEPELSSRRASLIGQISNHSTPEGVLENIPVLLKSGRQVVAETRSNRFGEFQLDYEQEGRLQLCVCLEGDSGSFQVPIKKLASDRSGAERLSLNSGQTAPMVESR